MTERVQMSFFTPKLFINQRLTNFCSVWLFQSQKCSLFSRDLSQCAVLVAPFNNVRISFDVTNIFYKLVITGNHLILSPADRTGYLTSCPSAPGRLPSSSWSQTCLNLCFSLCDDLTSVRNLKFQTPTGSWRVWAHQEVVCDVSCITLKLYFVTMKTNKHWWKHCWWKDLWSLLFDIIINRVSLCVVRFDWISFYK